MEGITRFLLRSSPCVGRRLACLPSADHTVPRSHSRPRSCQDSSDTRSGGRWLPHRWKKKAKKKKVGVRRKRGGAIGLAQRDFAFLSPSFLPFFFFFFHLSEVLSFARAKTHTPVMGLSSSERPFENPENRRLLSSVEIFVE